MQGGPIIAWAVATSLEIMKVMDRLNSKWGPMKSLDFFLSLISVHDAR
jgi:hypothetical protein